MRTLFPHQENALAYAASRNRIALFMEMRLGKSLVTIRWLIAKGAARILILAPSAPLNDWWRELEREGEMGRWWMAGQPRKIKQKMARMRTSTRMWHLLNYEGLRAAPELLNEDWDAVICDESTYIRNPSAKITKLLTTRCDAPLRAVLSGLPAPESSWDYYSQMKFLHGSFLGFYNFWAFRAALYETKWTEWDWSPKPQTVAMVKDEVHRHAFLLTRKQAGLGNRKVYERRMVAQSAEQRRYVKQIQKEFRFEDLETNFATTQAIWEARLAGGFSPDRDNPRLINPAKINELLNLINEELRQEKVVVWFRFNDELHAVAQRLQQHRIRHTWLMGAASRDERLAAVDTFSDDSQCRVILVQGKLGKFSLNLSASSTAIYYSNHYDMEVRAQSEDRIEHMTKHEPLLYIDLVTEDSIDEDVVDILQEKKIESRQLMTQLVSRWNQRYREAHGLVPQADERPRAAIRRFPEA